MIRIKVHKTQKVKRTVYEAVEEVNRPNKFWVLKVSPNRKVEFLIPARTLEGVLKSFDKIIRGLN